jgi:hypothetical protein
MTPEQATRPRSRLMTWLVSHQGWYFFPILMQGGLSLRSEGIRRVVKRGPVERRWIELTMLTVRLGGLVALCSSCCRRARPRPSLLLSLLSSAST